MPSICVQHAGSNIDALRLAIQELGFNEITNEHDRDITWNGAYFYKNDRNRSGYVNKFPGIHNLLTKISVFKCLEIQRSLFPQEYNFYPPTWFLPYQFNKWSDFFTNNETLYSTYIVKPSGGTQGKGIYLVQSPRDYCEHHSKSTKTDNQLGSSSNQSHSSADIESILKNDSNGHLPAREVLQLYESLPALVSGYKIDLRIYVILESISPLRIHIYRDGLVRLASTRYEPPAPVNIHKQRMHLTNYSINKFSKIRGFQDMAISDESGRSIQGDTQSLQDHEGWDCKRRLRDFFVQPDRLSETESLLSSRLQRLRRNKSHANWGNSWHLDPAVFWPKVDDLIRNTMFALLPYLRVVTWAEMPKPTSKHSHIRLQSPNCFQIFGFDLLLLEPDFRPVLLEVNSSPSLRIDCMRPIMNLDCPKRPLSEVSAVLHSGLVFSPRYAAFSRSFVDEEVKVGLLIATLSLIGSRLIFRRLLENSPHRAQAFLAQSQYWLPSEPPTSLPEEPACEEDNDNKASTSSSDEGRLQAFPGTFKQSRRSSVPASLGNLWLCERIAKIYDIQEGSSKSTRKPPIQLPQPNCQSEINSSLLQRVSNPEDLVHDQTPKNPSRKAEHLPGVATSTFGTPSTSDIAAEVFIDRMQRPKCRSSRNLLHCIYAEDNLYYPNESNTGSKLPDSVNPQSDVDKTENNHSTINEVADSDGASKSVDRSQSAPSLQDLRQFDHLAEIFIAILSNRKQPVRRSTDRTANQRSESISNHSDSSAQKFTPSALIFGPEANPAVGLNMGVDAPTPRMDITAFHSFVRRCMLHEHGMSSQDLDHIYLKHRLLWFRVFEPDCPEAENGISFPAFVELCMHLATKYFWPSQPDLAFEPVSRGQAISRKGDDTSLLRTSVFAFIRSCCEGLKRTTKLRDIARRRSEILSNVILRRKLGVCLLDL